MKGLAAEEPGLPSRCWRPPEGLRLLGWTGRGNSLHFVGASGEGGGCADDDGLPVAVVSPVSGLHTLLQFMHTFYPMEPLPCRAHQKFPFLTTAGTAASHPAPNHPCWEPPPTQHTLPPLRGPITACLEQIHRCWAGGRRGQLGGGGRGGSTLRGSVSALVTSLFSHPLGLEAPSCYRSESCWKGELWEDD